MVAWRRRLAQVRREEERHLQAMLETRRWLQGLEERVMREVMERRDLAFWAFADEMAELGGWTGPSLRKETDQALREALDDRTGLGGS